MANEYKLNIISMRELEAELEDLKNNRVKEVAEQLKEARSFGDLSENSEYDEAKNEQARVYGRIAELENILSHAVVIDEREDGLNQVTLGGTVKLLDMEYDEECVYAIVGTRDANPNECKISEESPLGKAIIGKKPGETVSVETPTGTVQFKILSFEK